MKEWEKGRVEETKKANRKEREPRTEDPEPD
jgi:hypothetical protein